MEISERAAWTAYITGVKASAPSKYHNQRSGKYASKHEAEVATKLHALASCGQITELKEQVRIELVPGRDGIRAVTYIADFEFWQDGKRHIVDAKGYAKNPAYRLKKRLAKLLLNIEIEEV